MAKQLQLFAPTRKRKRRRNGPRLGRPPRADREGFVPHAARPVHDSRQPVHVTVRTVRLVPSLRSQILYRAIVRVLAWVKSRGVRVIQYDVQPNHLHLMTEAEDAAQLSRNLQLLLSRIAKAVNQVLGRRGSLFRDRHHRVALTTPTQTRRALVYILFNSRKHDLQRGTFTPLDLARLDEKSSGPWFDGWHHEARPSPELVARCRALNETREPPIAESRTWLARVGWRRGGGPIRFDELPHFKP